MKASESTYEQVAKNCTSFEPKGCSCNATNSVNEKDDCHSDVSCRTCKHFASDEHCVLDLYDKIAANHHIG